MSNESGQTKYVVFDPKAFIHGPYRKCPSCNAESAFGVLLIGPYHYVRRCRECWHDASFTLPRLKKSVLYLDQFAISNMMKALHPAVDREIDVFWLELFRRVDRLCKLQLLVCPESELHTEEALVAPFAPELKRMYELLSGGVTLHGGAHVQRVQIFEHVRRWARGGEREPWKFDLDAVTNGDLGGWQERLRISVQWTNVDERVAEIRKSRAVVDREIVPVFERWQAEKGDFWTWFGQEARSYRTVLDLYLDYYRRLEKIRNGTLQPDFRQILPPLAVMTIRTIREALRKAGVEESEIWPKVMEYLLSDALETLPFNRISALLTAAVARKVAAGQKRPPTRGMLNDIRFLSTYLPYCDAMLVDNECHGLSVEQPLRDELAPYDCRIFCMNTKDDLMAYLGDIEAKASPEHLATVREVYGESWEKPYETMYGSEGP